MNGQTFKNIKKCTLVFQFFFGAVRIGAVVVDGLGGNKCSEIRPMGA